MSKQIAILIDNSGSMFHPVGEGNANDKIYETARGVEYFIENLIDEVGANPDSDFAVSVHRFAEHYQLLPGGQQIDSGQANFVAALGNMRNAIAQIENQSATQAAVGSLTDLYQAIFHTSTFLDAEVNQPSFGDPDQKVLFLFSDGIQTIAYNGERSKEAYEAAQGVTFENLLAGRGLKMVGWGVGSDALKVVLDELVDDAIQGGENPVSDTKVLFPTDEGMFPNCTTLIAQNAIYVVSQNGVLPLQPMGGSPSGLLWEQFSLPSTGLPQAETPVAAHAVTAAENLAALPAIGYQDFEVDVDGSSAELVLLLVAHQPRAFAEIVATSPSGASFTRSSAGVRHVSPTREVQALKVVAPEAGVWHVRVSSGKRSPPSIYDLAARGVQKRFGFQAAAQPKRVDEPGTVKIVAWARWDGKPSEGCFDVKGQVLGGNPFVLERQADGTYAGEVALQHTGIRVARMTLKGTLPETGATITRIAFSTILVGPARDPRFAVAPDVYERGAEHELIVRLRDAKLSPTSAIRFGDDVQVLEFKLLTQEFARVRIRVGAAARIGARVPVLYGPNAECLHLVRVIEGQALPDRTGEVCCLRFDARGRLVGVVMCDGSDICVQRDSDRLLRLLENARDRQWTVRIKTDEKGCLEEVEVCRP